jgi:sec-independent protein translocase protein TatC
MTDNQATDEELARDGAVMPWMAHLRELRKRIIIVAAVFLVFAIVCFAVYPQILDFLKAPYCRASPKNCQLYIRGPLEGLSLRVQIAAYGSVFCTLPVLLFEAWQFVVPGLKDKERKYALPFVLASTTLFLAGMVLAYFTFEHALQFLITIGGKGVDPLFDPTSYLRLIVTMMLAFGVTFEFPVILVALELAGVVTPKQLLAYWRAAIIAVVTLAAVFTPSGDPFSMLVLACPLIGFYFIAIGIGKLLKK